MAKAAEAEKQPSLEAQQEKPNLELVDSSAEVRDVKEQAHDVATGIKARLETGESLGDQVVRELEGVQETAKEAKISEFDAIIEQANAKIQVHLDGLKRLEQHLLAETHEVAKSEADATIDKALDQVKNIELMSPEDVVKTQKSFLKELKGSQVSGDTMKDVQSLFKEISSPYASAESVAGQMVLLSKELSPDQIDQLQAFLESAAPSLANGDKAAARVRIGKEGFKANAVDKKVDEVGEKQWNKLFSKLEKTYNTATKNPQYAYATEPFLKEKGQMAIAEAILNGEYTQEEIESAADRFRPEFKANFMPSDELFAEAMTVEAKKDFDAKNKKVAEENDAVEKGSHEFQQKQAAKARERQDADEKKQRADAEAKRKADESEAKRQARLDKENEEMLAREKKRMEKEAAEKEKVEKAAQRKAELADQLAKLKTEGAEQTKKDAARLAADKAKFEEEKSARSKAEDKRKAGENEAKRQARLDKENEEMLAREKKRMEKEAAEKEKLEKATKRKEELAAELAQLKAEGKAQAEKDKARIDAEKAKHEEEKAAQKKAEAKRKSEQSDANFHARNKSSYQENFAYNKNKREKAEAKQWDKVLDAVDVGYYNGVQKAMFTANAEKRRVHDSDDLEIVSAGKAAAAEAIAASGMSYEDITTARAKYRPEADKRWMPNKDSVERAKTELDKKKAEEEAAKQTKKPGLFGKIASFFKGKNT